MRRLQFTVQLYQKIITDQRISALMDIKRTDIASERPLLSSCRNDHINRISVIDLKKPHSCKAISTFSNCKTRDSGCDQWSQLSVVMQVNNLGEEESGESRVAAEKAGLRVHVTVEMGEFDGRHRSLREPRADLMSWL